MNIKNSHESLLNPLTHTANPCPFHMEEEQFPNEEEEDMRGFNPYALQSINRNGKHPREEYAFDIQIYI